MDTAAVAGAAARGRVFHSVGYVHNMGEAASLELLGSPQVLAVSTIWIDRRLRLIPIARRRHRAAFPEAGQYDWRVSDEFRPQCGADEAEALRVARVRNMPGSYCSAGDAGKRMLVD